MVQRSVRRRRPDHRHRDTVISRATVINRATAIQKATELQWAPCSFDWRWGPLGGGGSQRRPSTVIVRSSRRWLRAPVLGPLPQTCATAGPNSAWSRGFPAGAVSAERSACRGAITQLTLMNRPVAAGCRPATRIHRRLIYSREKSQWLRGEKWVSCRYHGLRATDVDGRFRHCLIGRSASP